MGEEEKGLGWVYVGMKTKRSSALGMEFGISMYDSMYDPLWKHPLYLHPEHPDPTQNAQGGAYRREASQDLRFRSTDCRKLLRVRSVGP